MNKVLEQLKEEYNETFNRMQDLGEIIANCEEIDASHCGQDAKEEPDNSIKDWSEYKKTDSAYIGVDVSDEEELQSLTDLLGMEVVCAGGSAMKCEGCSWDCGDCVKVELVGGTYMCLAKPQQEEHERPVISFDEEEQEGLGDIMKRIKEDTEAFMDYLEDIVKTEEQ